MKKSYYIISFIITIVIVVLSCERVEDPVITDFSLVNDTVRVRAYTDFNIAGDADMFAIWPGEDGNNYYAFLEQTANPTDTVNVTRDHDRGSAVEPGIFSYRYMSRDTLIAVLIATNYGDDGNEIKQVKKEINIIVQ